MLLSKSCIYGIRATLLISMDGGDDYISIREVSEKLNISFHFLTKTLQQLTAVGFLESYKGPKGGIRLLKPAEEISLLDIVLAIDGDVLLTQCVLGLPGCGTQKPCPLHEMWSPARNEIVDMLKSTNMLEVAQKIKDDDLRLTANGGLKWDILMD